jgi:hypothetical protein
MRACAVGGAPREAFELLKRMKGGGNKGRGGSAPHLVPPSPNIESYNITLSAFAFAGWWEKALELIGELRSPHHEVKPNVDSYGWAFLATQSAPLNKRSALARQLLQFMHSDNIEPNMVSVPSLSLSLSACL